MKLRFSLPEPLTRLTYDREASLRIVRACWQKWLETTRTDMGRWAERCIQAREADPVLAEKIQDVILANRSLATYLRTRGEE